MMALSNYLYRLRVLEKVLRRRSFFDAEADEKIFKYI
jgi:hypothetical protein